MEKAVPGHHDFAMAKGDYKTVPDKRPSMKDIMVLVSERDAAFLERSLVLAEKRNVLAQRDLAVRQRDAAIVERDNDIKERDQVIEHLQLLENVASANNA